jgi:hypothetical protein|tara:strand:- start:112 stop:222 length:111 start_codon:yes stop_codon:yes gene_type:complete
MVSVFVALSRVSMIKECGVVSVIFKNNFFKIKIKNI